MGGGFIEFLGGESTNYSLIFHAEDTGTSCCVGLACFCGTNMAALFNGPRNYSQVRRMATKSPQQKDTHTTVDGRNPTPVDR